MILLTLLMLTQIDVTTTLQSKYKNQTLTIGDPFEITVSITHPYNMTVSEPFVDSLGPFMIIDTKTKIIKEKGNVLNTHNIRMATFNTGDMVIPGFQVVHTHGDTIDTISGNTVPITIQSVMPKDMTDINDLKKAVAFPNFLPLIIAGIVLVAAVLAYLVHQLVRKILRVHAALAPLLPPWIEALAAIESIPVQEWLNKGWIKRYYYALSEILKRYIEQRFAFNAAEQTTSELIATMKTQQVPLRDEFHNFFQRADMVKYAKLVPPKDEIQIAVHTAKDLVNKTTPQEVPHQ